MIQQIFLPRRFVVFFKPPFCVFGGFILSFRGSGGKGAYSAHRGRFFCLKKCLKSPYNTMDGNGPIYFTHKEVLCNIVLFGPVGTSC